MSKGTQLVHARRDNVTQQQLRIGQHLIIVLLGQQFNDTLEIIALHIKQLTVLVLGSEAQKHVDAAIVQKVVPQAVEFGVGLCDSVLKYGSRVMILENVIDIVDIISGVR